MGLAVEPEGEVVPLVPAGAVSAVAVPAVAVPAGAVLVLPGLVTPAGPALEGVVVPELEVPVGAVVGLVAAAGLVLVMAAEDLGGFLSTQLPPWHTLAPVHFLPQLPQFCLSVAVSTQAFLHTIKLPAIGSDTKEEGPGSLGAWVRHRTNTAACCTALC